MLLPDLAVSPCLSAQALLEEGARIRPHTFPRLPTPHGLRPGHPLLLVFLNLARRCPQFHSCTQFSRMSCPALALIRRSNSVGPLWPVQFFLSSARILPLAPLRIVLRTRQSVIVVSVLSTMPSRCQDSVVVVEAISIRGHQDSSMQNLANLEGTSKFQGPVACCPQPAPPAASHLTLPLCCLP